MKPLAKGIIGIIVLLVTLLCSRNITQGMFICMNKHISNTAMQATYKSFNGSLTRKTDLKTDDQVRFSFEGDDGLRAVVRQGKKELFEITDGSVLSVPKDGNYTITVEGKATNGAFDLTWEIIPNT